MENSGVKITRYEFHCAKPVKMSLYLKRKKTKFQGVNSEYYREDGKFKDFINSRVKGYTKFKGFSSKIASASLSPMYSDALLPTVSPNAMRENSGRIHVKTSPRNLQGSKQHLKKEIIESKYLISGIQKSLHSKTIKLPKTQL
jgi:hypothetical protein